jgi:hypothetical protein
MLVRICDKSVPADRCCQRYTHQCDTVGYVESTDLSKLVCVCVCVCVGGWVCVEGAVHQV